MKFLMPSYCREFRCSADKCSDNCCIGWEIDIDEATAEFYSSVDGDFGRRLGENICHGECSSFILKGERCPFLNEKNLCDIIINLGEDKLCQICSDHPRYNEWYGDIKEGGVGLCCEEAARLILTAENPLEFTAEDIPYEEGDEMDEGLFTLLYMARNKIFSLLSGEESVKEKVSSVLAFAEQLQVNIDNYNDVIPEEYTLPEEGAADMLSVLKSLTLLEPIDEKWTEYLDRIITEYEEISEKKDLSFYEENLLIYFIYRYFLKGVFDGEILSKVKLACVSTAVIAYLIRKADADFSQTVDICKLFSKQIEYSQENIDLLADMFYEKDFYESASIAGLF
ncbi:MAG: flagellin lysine-N-methylase [Clostridia bacterium]|nr:flagellin lysine-N-methylase [Clostridia bacterium]